MAQKIQSDLGVTHTCHVPNDIVPVTLQAVQRVITNWDLPFLKEEHSNNMFWERFISIYKIKSPILNCLLQIEVSKRTWLKKNKGNIP